MPNPVVLITNPGLDRTPRDGQYPGTHLTPQAVTLHITGTAWAVHPATTIQDGNNGTLPITYSIDGGAPQNVNLTTPANTRNPSFTFAVTAANTGNAGGARIGHTLAITAHDDAGQSTTVTLTLLRSN